MVYAYKDRGNDKNKRRRSVNFNKRWIGRNASQKSLERYCNEIWSDIIKIKDNNECCMCKSNEYLNSHHLISKKWKKTAHQIECGITLCKKCHEENVTAAHITYTIRKMGMFQRVHHFNFKKT